MYNNEIERGPVPQRHPPSLHLYIQFQYFMSLEKETPEILDEQPLKCQASKHVTVWNKFSDINKKLKNL